MTFAVSCGYYFGAIINYKTKKKNKSKRMKLSAEVIHKIAQELEAGMKVYLNRKTLEFEPVLDWDDISDTDFWEKEARKIERKWKDHIIITKMESREAFQVMENFIDEVDDPRLKEDLIKILNRRSPFANFKMEVESSSHRQQWFDFRTRCYEDYIREQLDEENIEYEK